MERLINADALKEKINKKIEAIELAIIFKDKNEKVEATLDEIHSFWCNAVDIIEAQPTVGQWIPCSKRLPDEKFDGGKLIATVNGHRDNIEYINTVVSDMVFEGEKWYLGGVEVSDELEVLAWQPLPEPYKEDK